MNKIRQLKIESLIMSEIGSLILMNEIKDPRVSTMISITRVQINNDMTMAKVYVSSYESLAKIDKAVDALNHAKGFIQSKLGKKLQTRVTPKLHFFNDHSIQEGFEMNLKIDEVIKDS